MFIGSVPREARIYLENNVVSCIRGQKIIVGCSGNFTIDKFFSIRGFDVYSNDVSLYSKVIADFLLKRKSEILIVNHEISEAVRQIERDEYFDILVVMYALRLSKFAARKNEYSKNQFDTWINNAPQFFNLSREKLKEGLNFRIKDFYFGDFMEHFNAQEDGIYFLYAPTYTGGYEKIFTYLNDSFEYKKAEYNIFESESAEPIYEDFLNRKKCLIYSDQYMESIEQFIKCKLEINGKKSVYLYSNIESDKSYLVRAGNSDYKSLKLVPQSREFKENDEMSLAIIDPSTVMHYKNLFMSAKVDYSKGEKFCLAVLNNKEVMGFIGFAPMFSTPETAYLISDFCVKSIERKLSKLIAMIVLSEDIRRALARAWKTYAQKVKTTVYTDKPGSMKYRGVFEIKEKGKGKLIYEAEFRKKKYLKDIYSEWFKKKN